MKTAIDPCECPRCLAAEEERPLIPEGHDSRPVHYVREFEALNHLKRSPLVFGPPIKAKGA